MNGPTAPTRHFAEALWTLVLAAYAALLAYLLLTGRLTDLVHPRMTPLVAVALVLLLLLAVAQGRSFLAGRRVNQRRPLLALFILPFMAVPLFLRSTGNAKVEAQDLSISAAFAPSAVAAPRVPADIPSSGPIVIDQDNYYRFYRTILSRPQAYTGRTLVVTGFVYHAPQLKGATRFLTARELMWCCAVDVTTIGFVSDLEQGTVPPEDSWVMARGTLETTTVDSPDGSGPTVVPLLRVNTLQTMEGYDYTYVYPVS